MSRGGPPTDRGAFITIDGPDGGGKTTQARRLAAHLGDRGLDVHVTREPGGTALGERIRATLLDRTGSDVPRDPLADALLFNAARRQLVKEVIRPRLDAGTTVVCARFADSTLAYQGFGAGVDLDLLRMLADLATDGLEPDITIVLDLPVEVGIERKAPADVTRFEAEYDLAFHDRVRRGFRTLAVAEPERIVVIDGTGDIDSVSAVIADAVDRRLRTGEPSTGRVRSIG